MYARNKNRRRYLRDGSHFGEGGGLDMPLWWMQVELEGGFSLCGMRGSGRGRFWELGCLQFSCKCISQPQHFSCHILGVYAPNCYKERRLVWEEIGAVTMGSIWGFQMCRDSLPRRTVIEEPKA